jgi:hypothetical protein
MNKLLAYCFNADAHRNKEAARVNNQKLNHSGLKVQLFR